MFRGFLRKVWGRWKRKFYKFGEMTPKQFVDFLERAYMCKGHKRAGWERHKDDEGRERVARSVSKPEMVLGHTGGVVLLVYMCSRAKGVAADLDILRCHELAVLHDVVCEWELGDDNRKYLASCPEEREKIELEKFEYEKRVVKKICSYSDKVTAEYTYNTWLEYATGSTPEGKFIKQLDKLDLGLQALFFRSAGEGISFEEFKDTVRKAVSHPWLKQVVAEIESRV